METIYDEQRARMRIILVGGMDFNAAMFKLIGALVKS
jgi:hypothetical protein